MTDEAPSGTPEPLPPQGDLRAAARRVAEQLRAAGHEAWFVGGCVRDRLLGHPLKDIDIVTDARPEQGVRLFRGARKVGAQFAVLVVPEGGFHFEVATFRKDGRYRDHRHPERIEFGTREDDARRRDFTINALYEDPWTEEVVDPAGGLEDLQAGRVRCVGEPERRFNEDALRMLRAIRFAARFNFEIDKVTWEALRERAHTIVHISPERHRDELTGILTSAGAGRGLRLLARSRLLHWLLPEVEDMQGVEQGGWHTEGDVFEHTVLALEHLEPRTSVTAWAVLLHDVGKPPTFQRDPQSGHITFYDHQNIGADMARDIMRRLRFPNAEVDAVEHIVRRHMNFLNVRHMRQSTLRRFLAAPEIEEELAVHRADAMASEGIPADRRLDAYRYCREKLEEFRSQGEDPMPPPLLNGHDVMAAGIPRGPAVGEALAAARDEQLDGRITTREEALEWLRVYARDREGAV